MIKTKIYTLTKEHTKHALNPRNSFGTVSIDIFNVLCYNLCLIFNKKYFY